MYCRDSSGMVKRGEQSLVRVERERERERVVKVRALALLVREERLCEM